MTLKTCDFDYELPPGLIAQQPLAERDASRMMVVHRETGTIEHMRFLDLPGLLRRGDLLVLNDTRVIPARLFGERAGTGGKVELLLVERTGGERPTNPNIEGWTALLRAGWKPREGVRMSLADGRIEGVITGVGKEGKVAVTLSAGQPLMEVLEERGSTPLPPYIKRHGAWSMGHGGGSGRQEAEDRQRYQTIYAQTPGAVAAPTAGLHFTERIFVELDAAGVKRTAVTLHVGPGTFRPVKSESVAEHVMDGEWYRVGEDAARAVNATRSRNGRVVAVGSTSTRTLEAVAREDGTIAPGDGRSSLFIYPPFRFRAVDVMLTNFHLPRSTLLMMVSAFAGIELVRRAYLTAVEDGYRFYSYGDCMLIL